MAIEDYFKKNKIVPRSLGEVSEEHKRIDKIPDDTEYFNQYFQTGLDVFVECVDYSLNKQLFDIVLQEARKHEDLFEPCCQSGIFGCYIASETGKAYTGMDINPFGIKKAKERAVLNCLGPGIFVLGDILEYENSHEAIVGRHVVNGRGRHIGLDIKDDIMASLSKMSKNIILIQTSQLGLSELSVEKYKRAFERHGYKFEILNEPKKSATGEFFVLKAVK